MRGWLPEDCSGKLAVTSNHSSLMDDHCNYKNVGGLNTKVDVLYNFLSDGENDIIYLTETWLTERVSSFELFPSQ